MIVSFLQVLANCWSKQRHSTKPLASLLHGAGAGAAAPLAAVMLACASLSAAAGQQQLSACYWIAGQEAIYPAAARHCCCPCWHLPQGGPGRGSGWVVVVHLCKSWQQSKGHSDVIETSKAGRRSCSSMACKKEGSCSNCCCCAAHPACALAYFLMPACIPPALQTPIVLMPQADARSLLADAACPVSTAK